MLFLSSADFFKNSFRNTIRVSNSLDPKMSGLIWFQTVCKGHQQTTLVSILWGFISKFKPTHVMYLVENFFFMLWVYRHDDKLFINDREDVFPATDVISFVNFYSHLIQFPPLTWMKWAVTCDFQQCGILTSVDTDEPLQPPLSLETPNCVQSVAQHS